MASIIACFILGDGAYLFSFDESLIIPFVTGLSDFNIFLGSALSWQLAVPNAAALRLAVFIQLRLFIFFMVRLLTRLS